MSEQSELVRERALESAFEQFNVAIIDNELSWAHGAHGIALERWRYALEVFRKALSQPERAAGGTAGRR